MIPSELLPSIFSVTLAGLRMLERNAFKSCLQFLIDLLSIKKGSNSSVANVVDGIFDQIGFFVVDEVVIGLVVRAPRTYLHLLADLLYKVISRFSDSARLWLKQALGLQGGTVNDHVTVISTSLRELFLKQVMTTRHIKRFKDYVKDFTIKCRGLDGTEYGSTT